MSALEKLGMDLAQAEKIVASRSGRGRRDSRICVCGHSGGSHFMVDGSVPADIAGAGAGEVGCQAGKVPCQCAQFVWVATASDVRPFIQKTEGSGIDHALLKGIMSAEVKGKTVTWREGLSCFRCGSLVSSLLPIPYNENGREAKRSTGRDMLMCPECREAIRVQASGATS